MFGSKKNNDPDAPSKCPSCSKEIGVEENTYRFQIVDFVSEDSAGKQRNNGMIVAISCSNCKKVMGFVNH